MAGFSFQKLFWIRHISDAQVTTPDWKQSGKTAITPPTRLECTSCIFASHTGWLHFLLAHGTSTKSGETLKRLYGMATWLPALTTWRHFQIESHDVGISTSYSESRHNSVWCKRGQIKGLKGLDLNTSRHAALGRPLYAQVRSHLIYKRKVLPAQPTIQDCQGLERR